MKCLITGAGGFIGGHLVEHLLEKKCEVHALDQVAGPVLTRLKGLVHFHPADILVRDKLYELACAIRPDAVFHLAAQSYPGDSWERPVLTLDVNVNGTIHLLEAIRSAGIRPRTLVVCSSAEYADEGDAGAIREDARLDPSSPYGVSKLAQDHVARLYFERYGLPVVRCRPFFLIGPRKTGDVSSDFARGIVAIERGKADHLPVGNLEAVRDLLDVRDGAEAFRVLATKGAPGEVYNVCSGRGCSLREVLDTLKGLSRVPVAEKVDAARLRPLDERVRIGDPSKLKALGWEPARTIGEALEDILEYWRMEGSEI